MASAFYPTFVTQFLSGAYNASTDDTQIALFHTPFVYDETHQFMNQLVGEVSDASYSRQSLANVTITQDPSNDRVIFTCDNVDYTGLDNVTVSSAVIFCNKGTDATNFLISSNDTNLITASGGPLTVVIPTAGFVTYTYTPGQPVQV